jgi:hypothetical protein
LLRKGWTLNASRKTAMLVCAVCVVPVVFAAHASNLWMATVLIGLAASAHQGWAANLFALASDLFPKQANWMNCVVAVWHPMATRELAATAGRRVVIIEADSIDEARKQVEAATL